MSALSTWRIFSRQKFVYSTRVRLYQLASATVVAPPCWSAILAAYDQQANTPLYVFYSTEDPIVQVCVVCPDRTLQLLYCLSPERTPLQIETRFSLHLI